MMMMMMITFLYSLRSHLPACYTRLFEKKLRLLGPSRMDVCSVALGVGMVAHHHVFLWNFSLHVFTRGRS